MIQITQKPDLLVAQPNGKIELRADYALILVTDTGPKSPILLAAEVSSLKRAQTLRDGITRSGKALLNVLQNRQITPEDEKLALPQALALLRMRFAGGTITYGNALRQIRKELYQKEKEQAHENN